MSVARDQNLSNDRQKHAPTGEAFPPTAGSIRVAVVTHPGRVRVSNEADDWRSSATVDWIIVPDKPLGAGLFVCLVADRLGGHAAGEVASRRAGRSIFGARAALVGPQGIAEILHAVDARRRMHADPALAGMGTARQRGP